MAKFVPLALEPIAVPPVAAINHCIVFPAETALKLDAEPRQITGKFAVTAVGAEGAGLTVTVTEVGATGAGFTVKVTAVRVALTQMPLSASA